MTDTHGTHDTLVLGVGNPLMGDDALGSLVVRALQARDDVPPHVAVMDGGTDGVGLVPVFEPYRRLIVVDAVLMGEPPGTLRRFRWQDVRASGTDRALSLHQSSLTDALVLAEALGSLPHEVVIYGVQPHNTQWDQPLSTEVERVLPTLINALMNDIRDEE